MVYLGLSSTVMKFCAQISSEVEYSAYTTWIPSHTHYYTCSFFNQDSLSMLSHVQGLHVKYSWPLNNMGGVRDTETHTTENPAVTFVSPNLTTVCPLLSVGDWFQDNPLPTHTCTHRYQNPWMPKSSIQNGIKQCTQLVICIWDDHRLKCNHRLKILFSIISGWICRCNSRDTEGWLYIHWKKSTCTWTRVVQGSTVYAATARSLWPSTRKSPGRALFWTSSGKNPRQLWAWPWTSSSPRIQSLPLVGFLTHLHWLQKWLKPSDLQTPLEAITGQIKKYLTISLKVLAVFNLCNWITIWPYPTILSLRHKVRIFTREATSEANHKVMRVFPFSS